MQSIYFASALVGGVMLLIQIVLALHGAHGDVSVDAHDVHTGLDTHESPLSLRTAVAFLTFFGIGGMAGTEAALTPGWTLFAAVASGGIAFWLVALAMLQFRKLVSSGNFDVKNAVGVEAKVYLSIPANKAGAGKVTVPIQGRTMQFRAITAGREIPTGTLCRVVAVHAGDTLEVESL